MTAIPDPVKAVAVIGTGGTKNYVCPLGSRHPHYFRKLDVITG
jgi:hypothetical protein